MASKTVEDVLFPGIDVRVEGVSDSSGVLVVEAVSTALPGRCPICRKQARRVHSTYQRALDEHPLGSRGVIIRPVELVGRLRSDRVMLRDAGPRRSTPRGGQPRKHGGVLTFSKPESWHTPDQATTCDTTRYGTAEALAWDRMHPRLQARGSWLDHCGELPLIHGTLIRLKVEHLPGDRDPKPVWLWSSRTGMTGAEVDLRWQAFLRRFDLEPIPLV